MSNNIPNLCGLHTSAEIRFLTCWFKSSKYMALPLDPPLKPSVQFMGLHKFSDHCTSRIKVVYCYSLQQYIRQGNKFIPTALQFPCLPLNTVRNGTRKTLYASALRGHKQPVNCTTWHGFHLQRIHMVRICSLLYQTLLSPFHSLMTRTVFSCSTFITAKHRTLHIVGWYVHKVSVL